MNRLAAPVLALLVVCSIASADNWPAWRGPTGQGHSEEKNLPTEWSATKNVRWKVDLKHQGNSTPVVWGDSIFLTQANKGGTVRSLLCLSRADGKLKWQKDVTYTKKERNWDPNWYCNASPATDGERVVVSHGSAGLFCYDLSGKELWKRTDLGAFEHAFGNSASPVLYGDLLVQWCGVNEKGKNYLLAVSRKTGEDVWRHDESFGSWITPVVAKVKGKDQLLIGQSRDVKTASADRAGYLKGLDPKTGKELWRCQGLNSYCYASPLVAHDIAVGMSGYQGAAFAVKLGRNGDITKDRLWLHPQSVQRIGSGVIVADHVYMVDESGPPRCYDLKTGVELWKVKKRPSASVTWGSMVHADGKLYVLLRSGETLVIEASPKYTLLAVNKVGAGEETNSSLAISNGEIFLRTFKHLYCIGGGTGK